MTDRSVTHATFVIERSYDALPARVFAAFADLESKRRWFSGPEEWGLDEHTMDFRVGGWEVNRGGPKGGPVHTFTGYYQDIVPDERIVFTYGMHLDETRISVSLATVELKPEGAGTKLIFTEQGAFLDGWDHPDQREEGTREMLDALGRDLAREPASA
jgi:uncharacterized protein YndB with AHSA1/START domain